MFAVFAVILSFLTSARAGVVLGPAEGQTVKLSVHYESLCPDSIRFITTQLYPSWQHFGENILHLDLNPFGKANVRYLEINVFLYRYLKYVQFSDSGSSWDFSCQHGPEECRGNKVQACILNKVGV